MLVTTVPLRWKLIALINLQAGATREFLLCRTGFLVGLQFVFKQEASRPGLTHIVPRAVSQRAQRSENV